MIPDELFGGNLVFFLSYPKKSSLNPFSVLPRVEFVILVLVIELNIFYNDNTLYVNLDEYLDDYVLNKHRMLSVRKFLSPFSKTEIFPSFQKTIANGKNLTFNFIMNHCLILAIGYIIKIL